MTPNSKNEFSHSVSIEKIFHERGRTSCEASSEECAALANRFRILAIKALRADCLFEKYEGAWKGYHLNGTLTATIVQSCIATNQPVEENICVPLDVYLFSSFHATQDIPETLEEEDIEFIDEDGKVDIGEIVAQYLSLSINPYPRTVDKELISQEI